MYGTDACKKAYARDSATGEMMFIKQGTNCKMEKKATVSVHGKNAYLISVEGLPGIWYTAYHLVGNWRAGEKPHSSEFLNEKDLKIKKPFQ
jgi:hypothetical protein